jgi:hypothetical protein
MKSLAGVRIDILLWWKEQEILAKLMNAPFHAA